MYSGGEDFQKWLGQILLTQKAAICLKISLLTIKIGVKTGKFENSSNKFILYEMICDALTYQALWLSRSGPRLNIKTVLSTYGDFHVKDKTAVRTSYL